MKLVTAAQMRELEQAAVAAGSSEAQLMEEAGLAVAQERGMTAPEGPAESPLVALAQQKSEG